MTLCDEGEGVSNSLISHSHPYPIIGENKEKEYNNDSYYNTVEF